MTFKCMSARVVCDYITSSGFLYSETKDIFPMSLNFDEVTNIIHFYYEVIRVLSKIPEVAVYRKPNKGFRHNTVASSIY